MCDKPYFSTERDLIFDWTYKCLELIDLINETTGTDELPWSPPVPTDLEELHYQQLRFWFIDHQAHFVPLWTGFYGCQDQASHEGCDIFIHIVYYMYHNIAILTRVRSPFKSWWGKAIMFCYKTLGKEH